MKTTDKLLDLLKNKTKTLKEISEKEVIKLCKQAFNQGFAGQFFCTTNARARSVPHTVFLSMQDGIKELSPEPDIRDGQIETLKRGKELFEEVIFFVKRGPLFYQKRAIGIHPRIRSALHLFVGATDKQSIRLLRMADILFPSPKKKEKFKREFYLLYLPEFEKPAIFVFPEKHLTVVLGSGYFGELKKGALRMLWYEAFSRNILGLHASLKVIETRKKEKIAVVILGLSGTGKTSTVMANQVRGGKQKIYQDDFIGLDIENLWILGTETGLYLKTEGVTKKDQPAIWQALMDRNAFWENVFVDKKGYPDFCRYTFTLNGRCVAPREALPKDIVSPSIDLNLRKVKKLVFVLCSRHNLNPILQRLTPLQFAVAFALGHTTGTSAGGVAEAGKEKFVEGTNPFILRKEGSHSNLFLEGLKRLEKEGIKVECLLLNTGWIGKIWKEERIIQQGIDITLTMSSRILEAAFLDKISWKKHEILKTEIPKNPPKTVPKEVCDPILAFKKDINFFKRELQLLNEKKLEVLNSMEVLSDEIKKEGERMFTLL